MDIEWNNFRFQVEDDEFESGVINLRIIDHSLEHEFFVFHLKLKKLAVNEIYVEGDYYQDTMNKETMVKVDKKISYAALAHEFFIANSASFLHIKNIYSSPLYRNELNKYMSYQTINFWSLQMNKKPDLPVFYIQEIKRFKLQLNN